MRESIAHGQLTKYIEDKRVYSSRTVDKIYRAVKQEDERESIAHRQLTKYIEDERESIAHGQLTKYIENKTESIAHGQLTKYIGHWIGYMYSSSGI